MTGTHDRPHKVLVTGASGFIGGHLVARLIGEGLSVRLMSRRARASEDGTESVVADALKPDSLGPALEGCDVAYYLIHSMSEDDNSDAFVERDRRGAENFARAAEAAGVRRIVYLGAMRTGSGHDSSNTLSPHLASRVETGQVFLSSRVPATVFGAALIVGAGGASFEMLRLLVERLPVMITPRWLETRTQPIALNDVLTYLVRAPQVEGAVGQIDIGGPEVLSYQEMMFRFAQAVGIRQPFVVKVPLLTPRLSAIWVDVVTGLPRGVTHALMEGLRNELIADTSKAHSLIPIQLTPFDEAVRTAYRALKSTQA